MFTKTRWFLLILMFNVGIAQTLPLPKPQLKSAIIAWWWPKNVAHMSLVHFKQVPITAYYQLERAVDDFKSEVRFKPLQQSAIDLIPNLRMTRKGVPDTYILNGSRANPRGNEKWYKELYCKFPPSKKFPWFLVVRFDIDETKQFVTALHNQEANFKQFDALVTSLPHITLGKITKITDWNRFLNLIEQINKKNFGKFVDAITTDSDIVLVRGRQFENYFVMIRLPWSSRSGHKLLKKVKKMGDLEQMVDEPAGLACLKTVHQEVPERTYIKAFFYQIQELARKLMHYLF